MGGKGQRRREKNYRAAHGGISRLPPPPDPSSLDTLPSKLRKIMSLSGGVKKLSDGAKRNAGGGVEKRILSEEGCDITSSGMEKKINAKNLMPQQVDHDGQGLQISSHEKKKKKRKRKTVNDLRFEAAEKSGSAGSKRKERKKQRLEERKKKHKRPRTEEHMDFRGREEIKFGEVVEAPPKLIAVPKVFKITQDASQERLRLQAVNAYRKRKGWTSRLGVQLPSPVTLSL